MKKSFLIVTMLFAISFSFAQNNMDWQYATRFGGINKIAGSNITPLNYPNHLEIDAEGNAYIFGTYGNTASFYNFPDDILKTYHLVIGSISEEMKKEIQKNLDKVYDTTI